MTTLTGIEIPSPPIPVDEEKHQMILEGLEDLAKGRTVSHKAVSDWAKSLSSSNPLPVPTDEDRVV